MPKNKFLNLFFIAFLAIGFTAATKFLAKNNIASTKISSLNKSKINNSKNHLNIQKLSGIINVQLSSDEKNYEIGKTFKLKAIVTPLKDIPQVNYEWAFNSEIQQISGSSQSSLQDLKANQPVEIEISLINHSSKNVPIFLHITNPNSNQLLGSSGHFNTRAIAGSNGKLNAVSSSQKPKKKIPMDGLKIFH